MAVTLGDRVRRGRVPPVRCEKPGERPNLPAGRKSVGYGGAEGAIHRGTPTPPVRARAPGQAARRGQGRLRPRGLPRRVHGRRRRRAGVTKPTLYDHFPSKRDLYMALIDADLETVRHTVSEALAAPTGNRERIRASFQAYFDFVDEHGARIPAADAGGRRRRPRPAAACRPGPGTHPGRGGGLIVRESEGRLDPAHAETVALALVGMVETAAQHDPGRGPGCAAEAVDTLVRFAWRGITGLTGPDAARTLSTERLLRAGGPARTRGGLRFREARSRTGTRPRPPRARRTHSAARALTTATTPATANAMRGPATRTATPSADRRSACSRGRPSRRWTSRGRAWTARTRPASSSSPSP